MNFTRIAIIGSFLLELTIMVNCQLIPGNVLDDLLPSLQTVYRLHTFGPNAAIDPNSITMSGFSSGAFMAMQFHVAHSSIIKGAGMFAGGPYARAYGYPQLLTDSFSGGLKWIVFAVYPTLKTVPELIAQARTFEANGKIDALANINGSRAFVYHGGADTFVQSIEGTRAAEMYSLLGADVKDVTILASEHGMPTDNYGGPCFAFDAYNDGVNNCQYEGIFDMFSKLYPNFIRPSSSSSPRPAGSYYYMFNQTEFVPAQYVNSSAYMAPEGYIYIPPGCQNSAATCRLHVAIHGCWQSIYDDGQILENKFATRTGYTQAADANNIVVVFPRADPIYVNINNTNFACWDFFGGTTPDFPFKTAPQIETIYNIIANLAGFTPIP